MKLIFPLLMDLEPCQNSHVCALDKKVEGDQLSLAQHYDWKQGESVGLEA